MNVLIIESDATLAAQIASGFKAAWPGGIQVASTLDFAHRMLCGPEYWALLVCNASLSDGCGLDFLHQAFYKGRLLHATLALTTTKASRHMVLRAKRLGASQLFLLPVHTHQLQDLVQTKLAKCNASGTPSFKAIEELSSGLNQIMGGPITARQLTEFKQRCLDHGCILLAHASDRLLQYLQKPDARSFEVRSAMEAIARQIQWMMETSRSPFLATG
ncbi:MAG TPA: hypothetical protein VFV43_04245 [Limnobacter sp.]|nr:hypothetical protein [Limnobacter sp.]